MQNLRKNKSKVVTKQMMNINREEALDKDTHEDLNRAHKSKNNNCCIEPCNECEPYKDSCKKHHHKDENCEPCQDTLSENCIKNTCDTTQCCSPVSAPNFSAANAKPYIIDANRVFDTMQFQTFQDAYGTGLDYTYEVIDVSGSVPRNGQGKVTIEEICFNYDEMIIYPGCATLEGYNVEELSNDVPCESNFDYAVCGERNSTCCSQGLGTPARYRQKGLSIHINGIEIILKAKCGCTELTILAIPSTQSVVFNYNTLSAQICTPSDGNSFILRQNYQTQLSVGCVGTGLISKDCCQGCTVYDFELPGGLDLVLCLREVVSIIKQEQIAVLGSSTPVEPRIVDSFSKVCDFTQCGADTKTKNNGCGCGCK